MEQERRQVLEMLQAGRISAEEAHRLLAALEGDAAGEQVDPNTASSPEPPNSPAPAPDFARFRRFWRYPFAGMALLTLLLGLLLMSATRSADGRLTLALLCTWPFFLGTLLLSLLLLWSRSATWFHVRVHEQGDRRVAISLPVPLRLAGVLLPRLRPLVPAAARPQFDLTADVLTEMRQLAPGEPLFLDVDDEDGDRVQVYVG